MIREATTAEILELRRGLGTWAEQLFRVGRAGGMTRALKPPDFAKVALSPMQELVAYLGPEGVHNAFTPEERKLLRTCFPLWATKLQRLPPWPAPRQNPGFGRWTGQWPLPPGPWSVCVSLGGRGSGKTTVGPNWLIGEARKLAGEELAIVAPTMGDVYGTCVENAKTGILAWAPPDFPLELKGGKYPYILCVANKTKIRLFSADQPERMRSHNLARAWCDELQSWRRMKTWELLRYALRSSRQPQTLVTCNPERGIPILRELVEAATSAVVQSSSLQNPNLPEAFFRDVVAPVLGTERGRETVGGELLFDSPGAIFKREWITRILEVPCLLKKIGIGLDPAETSRQEADDSGIVAAGLGEDGVGYVLKDRTAKAGKPEATPDAVAKATVDLYWEVGASFVVVDAARNGELYKGLIRLVDPRVRVICKGGNKTKQALAEPVSPLYENKRVRHLGGLDALEDQMCEWSPSADWSPDRMDAACAVLNELMNKAPVRYEPTPRGVATRRI